VALLGTGAIPGGASAAPLRTVVTEREVDAPVFGPQDEAQSLPRAVCHARGCLAIWRQDGSPAGNGVTSRVWAARLSTDGRQQDPAPFLIDDRHFLDTADVATNGASFVVVGETRVGVGAVVVDADGKVSALKELDLKRPVGSQSVRSPSVSFGGGRYLVAFQARLGFQGDKVSGVRLDEGGNFLDAAPIPLSPDPIGLNGHYWPSVAFTGAHFVVAWVDGTGTGGPEVRTTRVLPDGTVLDPGGFSVTALPFENYRPRLASGGATQVLVASPAVRYPGSSLIVRRLDADGKGARPVPLPRLGLDRSASEADVAWNGTHFLVTWVERSPSLPDVAVAVRVLPDGTVADAAPTVLSSSARPTDTAGEPHAVGSGSGFLVLYTQSVESPPGSVHDVLGWRSLDAAGAPGGTTVVQAANRQRFLGAGHTAGKTLLVWADQRGGRGAESLRAARVADGGTLLDAQAIMLRGPSAIRPDALVAGAAGGFLVVGSGDDGVFALPVTADGAVLDPKPMPTASGLFAYPAKLVGNDLGFLLLRWGSSGSSAQRFDLKGVPVGDPVILGGIGPATDLPMGREVGASGTGDSFLVTWWGEGQGTRGARIGSDGTVTPGLAGALLPFAQAERPSQLTVVGEDTRALLLWGTNRTLTLPWSGPLAGLGSFSTITADAVGAPAWDGARLVDAIAEGLGYDDPPGHGALTYHLRAADGSPLGKESVFSTPMPVERPTVIGLGEARSLLAYARVVGDSEVGTYRVRYRVLDSTGSDGGTDDAAPRDAVPAADGTVVDAPAEADAGADGSSMVGEGGVSDSVPDGSTGGPTGDGSVSAADARMAASDQGCSCQAGSGAGRRGAVPVVGLLLLSLVIRRPFGRRSQP
jgi:hypothetical protein